MNASTSIKRSLADIIAEKKALKEKEYLLNAFYEENEILAEQTLTNGANAVSAPRTTASLVEAPILPVKKMTLQEILAAKRNLPQQTEVAESISKITMQDSYTEVPTISKDTTISAPITETFSLTISLNEKQLLARSLAFSGKSFCLVGAAGTGKTTAQREIAKALLEQDQLKTHNFKIQGLGERWSGPSIAFVAYTRIASGNLKRAIHKDPQLEDVFLHNITTLHNLLEYEPEYYWCMEKQKETMRFIPKRNSTNPLDITHLIIEEASMVGLDLWFKLYDALRPGTQIIMLGDINQLPPVFGPSILNYALVQLPVIELTHVYRQKGDSNILENAHRILKGNSQMAEAKDFKIMRNGEVQHSQAKMATMIGMAFPKFYDQELLSPGDGYDPAQDIILSPFNKADLGTDSLNKWLAQFLGSKRNAVVYEVLAGITKLYLAVGDKVMYNKQVGEIIAIAKNGEYAGKDPMFPSAGLTRFGCYTTIENSQDPEEEFTLSYSGLDLDKLLEEDTKDNMVRSASHHVKLMMETGLEIDLCTVGDFAPSVFSLGYALTVHKSQGCEWRKVFIVLHKDHSVMAFRELLYTAVTRARENVILITKDFMIKKAVENPRIKGNTIEEKIEYFNSGLLNKNSGQRVFCTKE
jgi:ATP-dependent exoDNAse (exonuclease V) alpha subunit